MKMRGKTRRKAEELEIPKVVEYFFELDGAIGYLLEQNFPILVSWKGEIGYYNFEKFHREANRLSWEDFETRVRKLLGDEAEPILGKFGNEFEVGEAARSGRGPYS